MEGWIAVWGIGIVVGLLFLLLYTDLVPLKFRRKTLRSLRKRFVSFTSKIDVILIETSKGEPELIDEKRHLESRIDNDTFRLDQVVILINSLQPKEEENDEV